MTVCGTFRQNAPAAPPGTLCSKGCGRPLKAKGLCNPCYMKAVKRGELEPNSHGDAAHDLSGERCERCGLRKPCNDCLPDTATEYAFTRMHSPANWPEGEHRMWTEPRRESFERKRRVVVSGK